MLTNYTNAFSIFENAYKDFNTNPSNSISQVNSSLESIMKQILEDTNIKEDLKTKDTTTNEKDTTYKNYVKIY